jgi:fluoroacetyl-CoA thioesterase
MKPALQAGLSYPFRVDGRKLAFTLSAHDGVDKISDHTHERVAIDATRFNEKFARKSGAR